MGEVCFDDGGTALVRRLRRVIRKLPILGAEPERCRLSASHISKSSTATPENTNVGRPPTLPLDFYLSWMSPGLKPTRGTGMSPLRVQAWGTGMSPLRIQAWGTGMSPLRIQTRGTRMSPLRIVIFVSQAQSFAANFPGYIE